MLNEITNLLSFMFKSGWIGALSAVFIVVCVAGGVAELIASSIRGNRRSALRKRGEKLIEAARIYAGAFRRNMDHDILVICTREAFQEAVIRHKHKVESGELKEWDKVVCFAKPLFTFAGSEQTRRPIHTGLAVYLENMMRKMLTQISGINTYDVSRKDYEEALSIIFVRDTRLFVPYAGKVERPEEQFAFYGKTTLEQALQVIKIKL